MSPENAENTSPEPEQPSSPKRKASSAGVAVNANGRPVKRRASKACQCCRARKVRCNVVEHGAPCTNCRLDEVPCIVTESKRRKKHTFTNLKPLDPVKERPELSHHGIPGMESLANGSVNPLDIARPLMRRSSESSGSLNEADDHAEGGHHVPHALYQSQNERLTSQEFIRRNNFPSAGIPNNLGNLVQRASIHSDLMSTQFRAAPPIAQKPSNGSLPAYIKPIPSRLTADDIQYLWKKGALSIPEPNFRNELLRSFIEFVHPYMPLIELHEFIRIVDQNNAEAGKISLLLFQAVMFAGTAFIDKSYLEAAGFTSRRAARKAFYQKARLLYDFDYEGDRISLVQSLLLMTYWYETPDDQKDTWHWMGVAISVAHTVGLHRNPEKSNMDNKKQRLWKRIWWSCLMRDRLVALGMRRPTRIKDEDYDVPMLTIQDFEIEPLASDITIIPPECRLIRNTAMQEDVAILCIAKAKLALCISHVLAAQYSVLVKDQGMSSNQEDTTRSRVILYPKKQDQTGEVTNCDVELTNWLEELAPRYLYRTPSIDDLEREGAAFLVHKALLHMVFYAAVSALHRPQVLPSTESAALQKSRDLQDISRAKVREASREITRMSVDLYNLKLVRYLPTTGVTVLLPAIIIHLLDIKSFSDETREEALQGFCQCMQVLETLRDNYASADYATQFLEAAIRKADIVVPMNNIRAKASIKAGFHGTQTAVEDKNLASDRMHQDGHPKSTRLTPPPDIAHAYNGSGLLQNPSPSVSGTDLERPLNGLQSASTPPESDAASHHNDIPLSTDPLAPMNKMLPSFGTEVDENTFDALINFDPAEAMDLDWNQMNNLGESFHGESGGFMVDMDWMKDGGDPLQWTSFSPHAVRMQPDEEAIYMMSDPTLGTGVS